MRAVELFAGAGGASLGMAAAGVEHLACIESNADAAATLAAGGFPAIEARVQDVDLGFLSPDLVWASPPCQPFSKIGSRSVKDDRNCWPACIAALRSLKPRWLIMENVVGLTLHRAACEDGCVGPELCPAAYFDLVILRDLLELFTWTDQRILNASQFGVPQSRRRLIVVAGPARIRWPQPTHAKPEAQVDFLSKHKPWATMRDCLDSLEGEPWADGKLGGTEPWRLDEPAPTVSGSEWRGSSDVACWKRQRASDALYLATGRPRLTTLETCRLQGFDVDFFDRLVGGRCSQDLQVGNAVPPVLAEVVTRAVIAADKAENPRGFSPQN